jgi:hypothetical protein
VLIPRPRRRIGRPRLHRPGPRYPHRPALPASLRPGPGDGLPDPRREAFVRGVRLGYRARGPRHAPPAPRPRTTPGRADADRAALPQVPELPRTRLHVADVPVPHRPSPPGTADDPRAGTRAGPGHGSPSAVPQVLPKVLPRHPAAQPRILPSPNYWGGPYSGAGIRPYGRLQAMCTPSACNFSSTSRTWTAGCASCRYARCPWPLSLPHPRARHIPEAWAGATAE